MLVITQKFMMYLIYLILNFLIHGNQGENFENLTIPNDFSIGTGISDYQVEGAFGRGESISDRFVRSRSNSHLNADVATDYYHKYKEDIQLLKEIGVNHFKFSLSWSRILPSGYVDSANESGIKFYHNVLDELQKYNITPIVTLYHFDFPQALEDHGGWLNESIIYVFADYARFIYEKFGSRVKTFNTINEIYVACMHGYEVGWIPPGVKYEGSGLYICAQNMLKAHALAYHTYDKEYRQKYKGEVGIVEACTSFYNKDPNDNEAEQIAHAFHCGLIFNPIFSTRGNFSDIVIRNVAERSALQGYNQSRLPPLSDDWVNKIRGSSDYLGLNYYTSRYVKTTPRSKMSSWKNDSGIIEINDPSWPKTKHDFFTVNPDGIGNLLKQVKTYYNNPKVYILETGIALDGALNDVRKIEYLYTHLKEVLIAIKRDKCNVKMFTVWSFLDTFELKYKYNSKYGLVSVDFNDKNLTRTMRKSSYWLQSVMKNKIVIPSSSMQ